MSHKANDQGRQVAESDQSGVEKSGHKYQPAMLSVILVGSALERVHAECVEKITSRTRLTRITLRFRVEGVGSRVECVVFKTFG